MTAASPLARYRAVDGALPSGSAAPSYTITGDTTQAYVSRIEAGQMNVTLESAEQIALALEIDVAELLLRSPLNPVEISH